MTLKLSRRLFTRGLAGIAAVAVSFVGLAGCGDDGADTSGSASSGGSSSAKPIIGVSIPAADHGWTAGVKYWADEGKKMFGDDVTVQIQTATGPDEQIKQIENMLVSGVDAMVVLATESSPLTETAKKLKERGVYLVNVDRGFNEPVADVYVAGDNAAFGRQSAEYMVSKMGGTGNVVIIRGIPSTVDTARVDAAMEVFEGSGVTVLDEAVGMWNKETALNVMQGLLQKHDNIDAVWAADDDMAEGVEQAIAEAQRGGEMWIMGGAGKKDIIKRVMDGDETFPADITYPPSMILAGIAIAKAELVDGDIAKADIPDHVGVSQEQLDSAKGQDGQKQVTLEVKLVTPENASEFYFPESVF